MEIKSKFLGEQQVDADTLITFPKGIPGFEDQTRFKLFHQEGSNLIYWLQSVDNAELTFSVAHPSHFNLNYNFVLSDEEQKILGIESEEDILILILLHKDEEQTSSDKPVIQGSIKLPLIINCNKRIGLQKVFKEMEQSITLTEKVAA